MSVLEHSNSYRNVILKKFGHSCCKEIHIFFFSAQKAASQKVFSYLVSKIGTVTSSAPIVTLNVVVVVVVVNVNVVGTGA